MRIISGIYKSRKLITPKGNEVRPTGDRAKETLFNILENSFSIKGAVCLDAFCGTGNLGLECISRRADKCYFVDKDIRLVKKNIQMLNAGNNCVSVKSDALEYLKNNTEPEFDFIFCDPPYSYGMYPLLLETASKRNSVFILEHSGKIIFDADYVSYLTLHKKIGTINFSIYDFRKLK